MPIKFGTETVFEYKEKLKLDKKDKKILYELYKNARIPVSVIAKKVELSKDTIKYRIRRMEKAGLILGYTTVVNLNRFGFHWNILLLQTKFDNAEQEKKFIEFLQSSKNVLKVMKCSGKWDYQIDVVYVSFLELDEIVNGIKKLTLLLDFSVLNCLKEIKYAHLPLRFFDDIGQEKQYMTAAPAGRVDESKEKCELDTIDKQLIMLLAKNSRSTLLHLSKSVQLSPDATTNRIKRLEKNGVLRGYMPVINTALLYDEHWIFIQINKSPGALDAYLKQHPSIQTIYEIGYEYDIFFWISATTIGEYEAILSEIKHKFSDSINRIDAVLALREYKYNEFPGVSIERQHPSHPSAQVSPAASPTFHTHEPMVQ